MPTPVPLDDAPFDVEKTIKKLVEVEKRPIVIYRGRQKELKKEVIALQQFRKKIKVLQNSLYKLYSVNSSFDQNSFKASPEGYVSGIASKNAKPGRFQINVLKLASVLRFSSKPIKKDFVVPKGTIGLGKITKKFNGGSLPAFKNFLNNNFNDLLIAKVVNITEEKQVLFIESKKSGNEGILDFQDHDDLLAKLELYNSDVKLPDPKKKTAQNHKNKNNDSKKDDKDAKDKEPKEINHPVKITLNDISIIQPGKYQIDPEGKFISLENKTKVRLHINNNTFSDKRLKGFKLHFNPKKFSKDKADDVPNEITSGPKSEINIKGIVLETYNIERRRSSKDTLLKNEYGIIIQTNGASNETIHLSLKGKKSPIFIPLKSNIKHIDFYVDDARVMFKNINLVLEHRKKEEQKQPSIAKNELKNLKNQSKDGDKKNDFVSKQAKKYPHLIRPAQNAKLTIDGVPIERKSNKGIKDVIEGVNLELYRVSNQELEVVIKKDGIKAKKHVETFVKAYNELLEYYYIVSKHAKSGSPGEYKDLKKEQGVLANNSSIRTLITGLKFKVSNTYPAIQEPYIRVMSSIGVSTGKIGTDWDKIKQGYLQIDNKQLEAMLTKNPRAVKEFFVIDSNGDKRPDNGFAYTTHRYLRPYTRGTGGIISRQADNKRDKIKDIDKKVVKLEEHAGKYATRLRHKMGRMQTEVKRNKTYGNMIKNRLSK